MEADSGFELRDVSRGISEFLSVKDEFSLKQIAACAGLCTRALYRKVIPKLERVIDKEDKITQAKFAAACKKDLNELFQNHKPSGGSGAAGDTDISVDGLTVQSAAGGYSLGLHQPSQPVPLDSGSIVVALGIQYNNYHSAIARTIYIDPLPCQKDAYQAAVKAYARMYAKLAPGVPLADVAAEGRRVLEAEQPALLKYLTGSFGCGVGIQPLEAAPVIGVDSPDVAKEGMVLILQIAIENIPLDEGDKKYAIFIANTVVVEKDRARLMFEQKGQNGKPQPWSKNFEWESISYRLNGNENDDDDAAAGKGKEKEKKKEDEKASGKGASDDKKKKQRQQQKKKKDDEDDDGEDEEDEEDEEEDEEDEKKDGGRRKGKKDNELTYAADDDDDGMEDYRPIADRLRGVSHESQSVDLTKHQKELAEKKLEEMRKRWLSGKGRAAAFDDGSMSGEDFSKISSFKSAASIIASATPQKVVVDNMSHSIILPMFGFMVPFHFDLVKSVTAHGKTLRVTFNTTANVLTTTTTATSSSSSPAKPENPQEVPEEEEEGGGGGGDMDVEKENDFNGEMLYIKDMKFFVEDEKESTQVGLTFKHAKASAQTKNEEALVPQGTLHLMDRPPMLADVCINPSTSSKRQGTLKAHKNGFRYMMPRLTAPIDVLYSNIKFSFFQRPEHEACIQIHFVLKNPIMVGKKKTTHVNFFTEVTVQTSNLAQQRSHYGDSEGLEEEARERRMRRKYTENYENFIKSVRQICPDLDFGKYLYYIIYYISNNIIIFPIFIIIFRITIFIPIIIYF